MLAPPPLKPPLHHLCCRPLATPQPYRFRRAWTCLKPSSVWSLFTPYKTLCEADAGLVKALQDRREMFCITDPDLYDNPISELVLVRSGLIIFCCCVLSTTALSQDVHTDVFLFFSAT